MSEKFTGGPAFPRAYDSHTGKYAAGMTIRDYFAVKAMLTYNTAPDAAECSQHPKHIARWCYEMADALIEERAK